MSRGTLRLAALVLGVIVVVVAIVLIAGGGDDDDSSSSAVAAEIASEDDLRERSEDEGAPIYWAGPQPGAELELSVPEAGRTYVRYLTGGAQAADPRPEFLTVGTYAFPGAVESLEELAEKPGGVDRTAPGGGYVYFNREHPQSVYLAYPGVDVQIEVFDPDPKRAKDLVTSGQIVPIE